MVPAALLDEAPDGHYHSRIKIEGAELLPLAGISKATTVLCNETGQYAIYDSDRHGFRNPPGLWSSAPADLMLVGDSFTIGECVQEGDTIADRLRSRWPKTLNLGFSGNSPLFELATLAEYGPTLRPRITLWIYFENDLAWFDLGKSARSPLLMRYLEPAFSQSLVERQAEIDSALRALLGSLIAQPGEAGPVAQREMHGSGGGAQVRAFLALRRTRRVLSRLLDRSPPDPEVAPVFEAVLRRAAELTSSWNGELIVVFLPGVWNVDLHAAVPAWAGANARQRVREIADGLGLRLIDVHPAVANHPDPLSLYSYRGQSPLGTPHMNAAGYALAAEVVRAALEDRTRR